MNAEAAHTVTAPDPGLSPNLRDYVVFPRSLGAVRDFTITIGLRAGYEDDAHVQSARAVAGALQQWMAGRAAAHKPFLTGVLSPGEVHYAYPTEEPPGSRACAEPVIQFRGEVSTLYNADLSDQSVVDLLNELAETLGTASEQTRVYLRYRDQTWVLQRRMTATPRGDSVA